MDVILVPKICANRFSVPSFLSFGNMKIGHVWHGEKETGNKRMGDQCEATMAS